jgi:hypothetical protein
MQDDNKKPEWMRDTIPSMKRRRHGHEYQSRCIYMITLVVEGRRPLLGHITGDGIDQPAQLHPTQLGQAILHELDQITIHYPAVKVISHQLMPDHLHAILYVQERIPRHLSHVITSFKVGCNRLYRAATMTDCGSALWETGFHDRILKGRHHLQRMMDYLDDNPRRLAIKRTHPDLFRVQRSIKAGDFTFAALGNVFLLDAPCLMQVQCTRKLTTQQIHDTVQQFLSHAQNGAVLVSPSISPGEKAVMKAAFEHGFPVIVLQENGFAPLAKPGGRRFNACAEGRLLLLAPWEHHNDKRVIKHSQCLDLNEMARAICTTRLQ